MPTPSEGGGNDEDDETDDGSSEDIEAAVAKEVQRLKGKGEIEMSSH